MNKAWEEEIRNAVNAGYGGLIGDKGLTERILLRYQKKAPLSFARKRYAVPVLIASLLLITATALALALMNKPASVSTYGLWRYADGQVTYQGESDKRPRVILEDENIRFIAADDMETGLYYITRQDGQTWLKNITQGGWAQTPGRTVNSKYNVADLQVTHSVAYILANTAQVQGQVVRINPFVTEQETPVSADGWANERISAFAAYGGTLYAYSAEKKELAVIDLSNGRLLCPPVQAGGILSLTAGRENEGDPLVLALIQNEAGGQKRLLLINARTGEMRDTGEAVPAWADYVNRNRENLYLLGSGNRDVKSFRISALSGVKVLHELYIVNGGSADAPVMEAAIRRFRQQYPDVELVFRTIEDARVVSTELMAGEGGIDVFGNLFSLSTPGGMLLKNGVVRDLTDNPDIQKNWEDWRDLKGLVSAGGRQFGVLRVLQLYAFAVSQEWAEKIGWNIPEAAWSMEEFEALVQKADAWNQTHQEHLYLLCDENTPYFLNQYQTAHMDMYAGTTDFETEEYLRLLKLYKDMNDKGLLYPQENLIGREKNYSYILPANTLLRVTGGGLEWMDQAERVIFPPSVQGLDSPYICVNWYLYANANSKYPEEAEYFLACYSSAEAVSQEYYRNYGQWLRDKALYRDEDPAMAQYEGKIREDTERVFNEAIARATPMNEIRELFWQKVDLLPAYYRGEITAEAFAAAMQQQADMVLGE